MGNKHSFPEMQCSSCPDLQYPENELWAARYCNGFPRKKKPKRFKPSDPKYKAPKWCPRRISPPVCRIYGFADERARDMDMLTRSGFGLKGDKYIYPSTSHYKLRLEIPLGINAKAFYTRSKCGEMKDFLAETGLSLGEIVEIDDGLRPYYFYCWSWSEFVPAPLFNRF